MTTNELFHQFQLQIWNITWTRYITEEIFSYQWWGILILLVIMYGIWIKLLDKSRAFEIILFGSFVAVQAVIVDITGFSMGFFQHNIRLLPIVPGVFPLDFTVVPILLMLTYQYNSTWSKYLIWSTLASFLFSFVISPIFQITGVKAYYDWNFAYFVILMMMVAVISRSLIEMIGRTVERHSTHFATSQNLFSLPQPAAKPLSEEKENKKSTDDN